MRIIIAYLTCRAVRGTPSHAHMHGYSYRVTVAVWTGCTLSNTEDLCAERREHPRGCAVIRRKQHRPSSASKDINHRTHRITNRPPMACCNHTACCCHEQPVHLQFDRRRDLSHRYKHSCPVKTRGCAVWPQALRGVLQV